MDKVLREYLKSVEEEASAYEKEQIHTKEYLQSMEEIEKWLKEQCDENSRN